MVKKTCPKHEGVQAIYLCGNQDCKLDGFFCDLCTKEGKHLYHRSDWMEISHLHQNQTIGEQYVDQADISSQNDNNNRTFHDNLYYQGSVSNRNAIMYTTIDSLENEHIISEPEDLKEFLSLIEEKVLNKFRSLKSSLLQKMIEFKNQYHHVNQNILKKELQEKRIAQKEYNERLAESNNYLGIETSTLHNLLMTTLQLIDNTTLQKFNDYDKQKVKNSEFKNNIQKEINYNNSINNNSHNKDNGDPKTESEKKGNYPYYQQLQQQIQQQQQYYQDASIYHHLNFSVAPFYKPTSQIEFFNNQSIIKSYNSDEAIISSKPLKFDKSYYLNFSISPNGESPTFGVMLVQEDCIQGEICFMHEGQISFVSDLNENTASLSLMKQKGSIVRPAHDIFWIDINLSQYTFNIYDEHKNMFFQIDKSKPILNKKQNWYLAFHLYDITLQIL
ncbi:hypothetical protein ABPG74_001739 [Tetrahymena malaccensis]